MSRPKLMLLLLALAAGLAVFFGLGLQRYFSLEPLKTDLNKLLAYRDRHPLTAALLYTALYIGVTGLSLPVAGVLTLAAGALFGWLWGTVIVSFASTIGATLAFLAARFLFHDLVDARFGDRIATVNRGFAREGAYYLFSLRLVPVFPYVLVNLAMGLTPVSTWTYYWVSQAGMLPGTLLYVVAGTQLAEIDSWSDIASPRLLAAFTLLGLFPLLARRAVEAVRARRVYRPWRQR